MTKNLLIRRDFIYGSKQLSNFLWASLSLFGGSVFICLGLASYYQTDFLTIFNGTNIQFFPQGILLLFYGFSGSLLSFYLWSIYFLSVGDGYNEFNKEEQLIKIFRWGFPGKNRKIFLKYNILEIDSLNMYFKEGINPQSILYLKLKNSQKIPLTRLDSLLTLKEFEFFAADLAKFLQVSLKEEKI